MSIDFTYHLETFVIGLLTGLLSGAFGVGGGIFCTPVLRMLMHVAPHVAVGTTMAMIIPTSVSGAINYVRTRMVETKLAAWLVLPALIGTVLGAAATCYVHPQLLMLLFAGLAAVAGLDLTFGIGKRLAGKQEQGDSVVEGHDIAEQFPHFRRTCIILGAVTGLMAGFFGVGGGFILVPSMLYFFKISIKKAFGTSLLIVAAVSIPGTVTHWLEMHVDVPLAFSIIAGAVPGSWLGSLISLRMKDSNLRHGFGIIMLVMSIVLAARELQSLRAY